MTEYPELAYHALAINTFTSVLFTVHFLFFGVGFAPFFSSLWEYGTFTIIVLSLNFALYTVNAHLSLSPGTRHYAFAVETGAAVAVLAVAVYLRAHGFYLPVRQYLMYALAATFIYQAVSVRMSDRRKIRFMRLYLPSIALVIISSFYIAAVVILFG